jgi:hypothetical protein
MASAKQIALEIIQSLPDDCSLQDVTDRLYTRQLIEEARDDIRQGRVFTHEQIEQEAARWLEP